MKLSKGILYPLGALVIIGVFWAGMVVATRSTRRPVPTHDPRSVAQEQATKGERAPEGEANPTRRGAQRNHQATVAEANGSPATATSSSPAGPADAETAPGAVTPSELNPVSGHTGIFVNHRELPAQQVELIRKTYGFVAPPGRYWYDPVSGLWGVVGREAAGLLQPGHDFGPMPANPSNGNTGVFINGREINLVEAAYFQRLFGAVYQGRWWLDGQTGNVGMEGNPMPVANVYVALRQAQSGGGQSYSWQSKITGAYGGSDGKCSYVSIPGSGSVMSGACD